jgi:hypothetical protein
MPRTKIARRAERVAADIRRNDELIALAANRADWARKALRAAARDLHAADGVDGKRLTGLAEVVLEEAARVSNLAEDINSHRPRRGASSRAAVDEGERDELLLGASANHATPANDLAYALASQSFSASCSPRPTP